MNASHNHNDTKDWQRILDAMRDVLFLVRGDFTIEWANQAAVEFFGLSRSDIIGQRCHALLQRMDLPKEACPLERLKKTGHYEEAEVYVASKEAWFLASSAPLLDAAGDVVGALHMLSDISERKRMEDDLRASEERFRVLFERAPDPLYLYDRGGRFVDGNGAAEEMVGYKKEELIGKSFLALNLLSKSQLPKAASRLVLNVMGKATGPDEYTITRKDGKKVVMEANAIPIQVGGKTVFLGIARDMTEHKRMEEELKKSHDELESRVEERTSELKRSEEALAKSEKKYRAIFDASPEPIVLMDKKGFVLEINERIFDTLGYRPEELRGKNVMKLPFLSLKGKMKALDVLRKRLRGESVPPYELEFTTKDGSIRMGLVSGAMMKDERGKFFADLIIVSDITDRKRMEEDLAQYSDHLEEIVEERSRELQDAEEQLVRKEKLAVLGQLAGGVAHELRNPLGAISNAVYLLRSVPPKEHKRMRVYQEVIEKGVADSDRIISGLLGLSRMKAGARIAVRAATLVSQAIGENPAPENINLEVKVPDDLKVAAVDPQQLGQVFTNLITNAYQAMPDGGKLVITAAVEGGDVRISFRDSGYGISDEDKTKLFEPLFTTKAKGIGLGLIVSKNLVEINGGRIEFESEEGKGSTFTVVLPVSSVQS